MDKETRKKLYKNVSCEMTTTQYNALTAAAKKLGIPKSELIRDALAAYMNIL